MKCQKCGSDDVVELFTSVWCRHCETEKEWERAWQSDGVPEEVDDEETAKIWAPLDA